MRPILYDADRTSFPVGADNGEGILSDALSCKVTQELNGQYELELHYPVEGIHYGEIALRSILRATVGPDGGLQPFRVYRIVPGMGGTAAIYARHIAYDLGGYVVSPFTAADAPSAVAGIKSHALPAGMPFTLTTDKTTAASMAVTVPTGAWALLGGQQGSLLDVYGGEYGFDGWTVRLLTRRGADRGVSVRYGKNLTDLTQDANCANCYTGVVPYWRGSDVTVTAAPVYAEGNYGYVRLMPLDLSSSFEQQPTQAQLQAEATAYVKRNQIGVPAVSWDVKLALLSQASGYEDVAFLEQIYLGDTVGVYFQRLGVDAKARVNKIVWDCLLERYDSVALGSVKANIAATIAGQQEQINAKPSVSMVEKISASLASALLGANGGSVRLLDTNGDGEPGELYIADDPDPAKARKVWRFNYEGFAASKNGYNGPFVMGATFDDGLMAWMVTTAHLVAGTITSEQRNFLINLDGGTIDTSATGATYKNSDYSQADLDRANQIAVGLVEPTLSDFEKLDVSGDGQISISDIVQIDQILAGERVVNFTTSWRLRIDPADGDSLLKVYRVYHSNITGADTENVIFSVGFGRATANTIGAQYGKITKDLSVGGTVNAANYEKNGQTITFPEQKVIGYVVYCSGSSANQASCFIPAGRSGSYQCASDDWFCAFSFDGAGVATQTGGTGAIDAIVGINNF